MKRWRNPGHKFDPPDQRREHADRDVPIDEGEVRPPSTDKRRDSGTPFDPKTEQRRQDMMSEGGPILDPETDLPRETSPDRQALHHTAQKGERDLSADDQRLITGVKPGTAPLGAGRASIATTTPPAKAPGSRSASSPAGIPAKPREDRAGDVRRDRGARPIP